MRTADLRTDHDAAALVAAALRPDNTSEVDTRVDGNTVVTQIERETTGGLARTVDDYAVNLRVADRLAAIAREHENTDERETDDTHDTS